MNFGLQTSLTRYIAFWPRAGERLGREAAPRNNWDARAGRAAHSSTIRWSSAQEIVRSILDPTNCIR